MERNIDGLAVRAKSLKITLKNTDNITVPIEIQRLPLNLCLFRSMKAKRSNSAWIPEPGTFADRSCARTLGLNCCLAGKYASIAALATEAKLHPKVIRNRIRLAF